MNVRSIISMEIIKENRIYKLDVPFGAPFEECHAVLEEFKSDLIALQEQQKKQAEEQQAQKEQKHVEAEPVQAELV